MSKSTQVLFLAIFQPRNIFFLQSGGGSGSFRRFIYLVVTPANLTLLALFYKYSLFFKYAQVVDMFSYISPLGARQCLGIVFYLTATQTYTLAVSFFSLAVHTVTSLESFFFNF